MKTSFLSMIFILFGFNATAQYTPAQKEYEDYSRKEIRKILLATDEKTEYYQLALASKKDKIGSTWYFIGSATLFIAGSLSAAMVAIFEENGSAWVMLPVTIYGASIGGLALGARHSRRSKQKLRKAWRLYQQY